MPRKTVASRASPGRPQRPAGPGGTGDAEEPDRRPERPDPAPPAATTDPAATDIERADERKAGSIELAPEPDPSEAVTGFLEHDRRGAGAAGL